MLLLLLLESPHEPTHTRVHISMLPQRKAVALRDRENNNINNSNKGMKDKNAHTHTYTRTDLRNSSPELHVLLTTSSMEIEVRLDSSRNDGGR